MANYKKYDNMQIRLPEASPSFDVEAFGRVIDAHGIVFEHHSAMRCPIGMTDLGDNRKPHEDHANCSNGFLYHKEGTIKVLFSGHSNDQRQTDLGLIDGGSSNATINYSYEEDPTKPFLGAPFDRLIPVDCEMNVVNWEQTNYHVSGYNKLKYPIEKVIRVIDADGVEYFCGVDFVVENGQMKWTTSKRPGIDIANNRGIPMTVRYLYKSFWILDTFSHELRVVRYSGGNKPQRETVRMPQACRIRRESFVRDSSEPDSPSSQTGPATGSFGPR